MDTGILVRSANDDFLVNVDYSAVTVYSASGITSAAVSVAPTTALVLGSASVVANVVTFRVSPGSVPVPNCRITILPTNVSSYEVERAVLVVTG